MRSDKEAVDIHKFDPPTSARAARRESIEARLNCLIEEMGRVAPSSYSIPWSDLAALLLTHPSPPRALRAFRKVMLAALRAKQGEEVFIDRLLECISAADKCGEHYQFLAPIRDSLIVYVSATTRRPRVAMEMVAKILYGTEIEQPIQSPFWISIGVGRQLRMNKAQAAKSIGLGVGHVLDLLLQERSNGSRAFSGYTPKDLTAGLEALWLAYSYCGIGAVRRDLYVAEDLKRDFKAFGYQLWMDLDASVRTVLHDVAWLNEADLAITLGKLTGASPP